VASRLIARDPKLWLSRSWTTRPQRPGESDDAYVFVNRQQFDAHVNAGGFFEWAEFLGNCYGTPLPSPPEGHDVLLEIEVDGARQVIEKRPNACIILLIPPSIEVQIERLRARGDSEDHVQLRVAEGQSEIALAQTFASVVVVNDDLDTAVAEVAGIIEQYRRAE
jgi:guanylate kinase